MRTMLWLSWTGFVLLGMHQVRAAEDESKAVLQKAVKAHGGAKKLERLRFQHLKYKGAFDINNMEIATTGKILIAMPDKFRIDMEADVNGQKVTEIQIVNGKEGWTSTNGNTRELKDKLFEFVRDGLYYYNAGALLPEYLKDKNYTLTPLGEMQINDKPAVGVKISANEKKDISLFFDKSTGLLVKTERQGLDNTLQNEVLWEVFYSDYKDYGGVKCPTKVRVNHDMKKYFEGEITETKLGEKIDDGEFARP